MPSVSPFLWFNERADEALALYERVFLDAPSPSVSRDSTADGEAFMSGSIRIGDTELIIFNGGPYAKFAFSESISLFVTCRDQEEVDRYWYGLSEGGEPGQCGWLKDPFGVSWQIVPQLFNDLMSSPDAKSRDRVKKAMLSMTKFDCDALQRAYDAGED